MDNIYLRNIRLPLPLVIGPDSWHRDDKPQPAIISLRITYPSALIANAAERDTVSQTLDYGKLYRAVEADLAGWHPATTEAPGVPQPRRTVQNLAVRIATTGSALVRKTLQTASVGSGDPDSAPGLAWWNQNKEIEIWIHLPKAILRAQQGLQYKYLLQGENKERHEFAIEKICCYCVLGVNPHERREKQCVQVALSLSYEKDDDGLKCFLDCYQELGRRVAEAVDSSSFETVEALATSVAKITTLEFGIKRVTVRVEKPSAQPHVEYSGVEITRTAESFS
ncbi:hypothetical protein VTO42DRAFT_4751 [Malbranchea cinnamomea]